VGEGPRRAVAGGPARILWLIKGLGPGGAERLVTDIVPKLDRERFSPEVAYLLPWKDHLVPALEADGIPVRCLNVRHHADVRWPMRLLRLIDGRFDLIHAHLPYAAVGARWAARRIPRARRPRVVYTEHNVWDRYRGPTALANAWTFPWNDRVIAVSSAVAASMRYPRAFAGRVMPPVEVIDNGVDGDRLRAEALGRDDARAGLGLPQDGLVVGTVGGITAKKGHVYLVRAARKVLEVDPSVRFVVVGLGADEGPVRREIAALDLERQVLLLGYREDAARLMPAFDVFCLPSLYEGMPLSLLEALAVGVPVVATSVGGVPAILERGGGEIVPPADPQALAASILGLLHDGDLRKRLTEGGPAVAARFDLGRTVRAIEAVYDDVLRGP
jgi:glycosyltransferase involved in cell wall biosynthesis